MARGLYGAEPVFRPSVRAHLLVNQGDELAQVALLHQLVAGGRHEKVAADVDVDRLLERAEVGVGDPGGDVRTQAEVGVHARRPPVDLGRDEVVEDEAGRACPRRPLVPTSRWRLDVRCLWRKRPHLGVRRRRDRLRALDALQGERYIRLAERRPANEAFLYGWLANRIG